MAKYDEKRISFIVDDNGETWIYYRGYMRRIVGAHGRISCVGYDDDIKKLIDRRFITKSPLERALSQVAKIPFADMSPTAHTYVIGIMRELDKKHQESK